jgi:hypothetical protein
MEFLKLSISGFEIMIIVPSGMGKDLEWEYGLGAEGSRSGDNRIH